MKVKEHKITGDCEWCEKDDRDLNLVTFQKTGDPYLLCDSCLETVKKVLNLLSISESDA